MAVIQKNDLPLISATQRNDFVEIKYTGYSNGEIFDSNIEEDLKTAKSDAKPRIVILKIGAGMIVKGFDKALEGKEIGKEYDATVSAKEGFGDRKPALVRTIPLKEFTSRKINPQAGMIFTLDDNLVKIITVSGARVIVDFNNPMAGKELKYKFTISRKVDDQREITRTVLEFLMRFAPEFDVKEKEVVIKGPKILEGIAKAYSPKFKEFTGKDLGFELKELPKEDQVKPAN